MARPQAPPWETADPRRQPLAGCSACCAHPSANRQRGRNHQADAPRLWTLAPRQQARAVAQVPRTDHQMVRLAPHWPLRQVPMTAPAVMPSLAMAPGGRACHRSPAGRQTASLTLPAHPKAKGPPRLKHRHLRRCPAGPQRGWPAGRRWLLRQAGQRSAWAWASVPPLVQKQAAPPPVRPLQRAAPQASPQASASFAGH